MRKIVTDEALKMAIGMTMNWLDSRGIMHCLYCAETTQLMTNRQVLDGKRVYLCLTHYAMAAKQEAKAAEEKSKATTAQERAPLAVAP
jgi:hypothetical protein